MARYHKQMINPLKKEWENVGVATLTKEEAAVLNDEGVVNASKTRYVLEDEEEVEFNVNKANGDALKAYAEENEIDLGDATKVKEIRAIIIESLEE